MRSFYTLAFVFAIFTFSQAQLCLSGGITFESQEAVDSFAIHYPGCTEIEGNVIVNELVSNFNGLSHITTIHGNLEVRDNSTLLSMEGFDNLTTIHGNLIFYGTWNLITIEGMESLQTVGGDLSFTNNYDLENVNGLQNLNSVGGELRIANNRVLNSIEDLNNLSHVGSLLRVRENEALLSLDGLQSLASLGGGFNISDNEVLSSLGDLQNLNTINGDLIISNNPQLVNITGLSSINEINGNLTLSDNEVLSATSTSGMLSTVTGSLNVYSNPNLLEINILENLNTISGLHLNFSFNPNLSTLSPLSNITGFEKTLSIRGNNDLTNLEGLEGLTYVASVLIEDNASLTSITGLNNIDTISGNIHLKGNPDLVDLNGLNQLEHIGGTFTISYSGCQTVNNLSNLSTIDGNLIIEYNSALTDISGFANLTNLGGHIAINTNSNLETLTGLEGLTSISNYLFIQSNEDLINLNGLNNLTTVSSYVYLKNNDALENLTGLESLEYSGGGFFIEFNDGLINLQGLENFTSLAGGPFIISNNSSLENLDGLQSLNTVGFGIEIVSNESLINLEGLSQLSLVDGEFLIQNNDALLALNSLSNLASIGGPFIISGNENLQSLSSLTNLNNLWNDLSILNNNSLSNLQGFENITALPGGSLTIDDNPSLLDLNALSNMTLVSEGIRIEENTVLQSLSGLENINLNNLNSTSSLIIRENDVLTICNLDNICSYLANGGNAIITDNGPSCENDNDILMECSGVAKVHYPIYVDYNQNAIMDSTDFFYPPASISIFPGNQIAYANAVNGGQVYLLNGTYLVNYNEATTPGWGLTTDSMSYTVEVDDTTPNDTIYFGIFPDELNSEMQSFIYSGNFRCNTSVTFNVTAQNTGSTITSGTLWFRIDEEVVEIDYIDTPDTIVSPDYIGWHFENLFPGQSIHKQINIGIPGPPDFELGENISFVSEIDFDDNNGSHIGSRFPLEGVVRCSFDPNDKLVAPVYPENYALIDNYLFYTIRFQNTGNAEALRVEIKDTLDSNLDPSTFRFISSSHEAFLSTSLRDNQFLSFEFNNINLPDSTSNLEGSQGYVAYRIKAKSDTPESTEINNTAGIYFDFNPPVITNTTENIMLSTFDADEDGFPLWDDCEDLDASINPDAIEILNNGIDEDCDGEDYILSEKEPLTAAPKLFPNPTTGFLEIHLNNQEYASLLLTEYTGKSIISKNIDNQDQLDLSVLPAGIYLVIIKTSDRVWIEKITKL